MSARPNASRHLPIFGFVFCVLLAFPAIGADKEPTAQAQGISITGDPSPSTAGQTITFSATYRFHGTAPPASPPGRVVFSDNGMTLGLVRIVETGIHPPDDSLDARATFTTRALAPGRHIITAIYLDDAERMTVLALEHVVR